MTEEGWHFCFLNKNFFQGGSCDGIQISALDPEDSSVIWLTVLDFGNDLI